MMFVPGSWLWLALSVRAIAINIPNVLIERADGECPSNNTYQSPIGLVYDTFCDQNLLAAGIGDVQAQSFTDCMDQCATLHNQVCYGVTYNSTTGKCSMKGSKATHQTLDSGNFDSALAQIPIGQTACPYPNATDHSTALGLNFEVRCGQDMAAKDYCPSNAPYRPTGSNKNLCPYHADTLQECMEFCSQAQSLCKGVSFDPAMTHGFGNCYMKSDIDPTAFSYSSGENAGHMALAELPTLDTSCDASKAISTFNKAKFDVKCDKDLIGGDLSRTHKDTLQACAETCSTTSNCASVAWDSKMQYGYQNCYLKTGNLTERSPVGGEQIAVLSSGSVAISTSPTSANSTSSSSTAPSASPSAPASGSSSHGWIAGPVIGGIVALVALAGLFVFLRRRRRADGHGVAELPAYQVQEMGTGMPMGVGSGMVKQPEPDIKYEMPSPEEIHELPGGHGRESPRFA